MRITIDLLTKNLMYFFVSSSVSGAASSYALYPLGPVATLRFCHLRPRCVSKQRRTTNVIITDRVWWIWCDAGLAAVATRPQRSPHSVASNSRPDYFAATRSRSLFLTKNECCVSAAAAAIWEIQWAARTPQLAPVDTGGHLPILGGLHGHSLVSLGFRLFSCRKLLRTNHYGFWKSTSDSVGH